MNETIERITIAGLHGYKTVDIRLKDNTLILVGENGSGKTTFLRILYHLLCGKWFSLLQFKFDYVAVIISGREYKLNHETLKRTISREDRGALPNMPPSMRRHLIELFSNPTGRDVTAEIAKWSMRYGMSPEVAMSQLELFDDSPGAPKRYLQEMIKAIRSAVNAQILYLPTYRRIERELSSIFEGVEPGDFKKERTIIRRPETEEAYIELVEFGMKDVEKAIEASLAGISTFARENLTSLTFRNLGDIVDREYEKISITSIAEVSEDTIRSVLDRVPDSILTALHKEHLLAVIRKARAGKDPDEHSKIVFNYVVNLLKFQEILQDRERSIAAFCELCSEYIRDKKFVYDRSRFSFSIVSKNGSDSEQMIQLSELSSGEKQIVSLFSHLYLSGKNRYFVLIDEPELSLSVPWQRRFLLDIRGGGFCAGLIAVTHSPFIYDNDLRRYAHSLGEFVNREVRV